MKVTYKIAMAAGKDAANRSMLKAGRLTWSKSDYNLACRVVAKLMALS
jgi:hypothetical protein